MLAAPLISFLEFTSMAFREPPARPGSSQHYNFEKSAADSAEFAAARRTVAALFPHEVRTTVIEPLQPGNSGMWPFKVTTSKQSYLLKVASSDPDLNVAEQAARARWASGQGLGPVVCAEHGAEKAYATQFLPGAALSHEQAAGEKMSAVARALRKVHTTDAQGLGVPGFVEGPKNWLFDQDLSACLRGSADVEMRLFANELVHIYLRSEKKLGEMAYAEAPVHDDIKADNAFVVDDRVVFIDWDNLKVADPMVDLAHFLWSVDAPMASALTFLNDYYSELPAPSREREEAHLRLQLRLFQVRLRSFAFFGQSQGNASHTRFYRYLLKDDIAAILPLI